MQDHPAARLEKCVYKAVAEVTGHALDELSPDLFLESDLGLDSIKTVELMNAIPPQLPDHLREAFDAQLGAGTLFQLQTLGELVAIIAAMGSGEAPLPAAEADPLAAAHRTPVLDVAGRQAFADEPAGSSASSRRSDAGEKSGLARNIRETVAGITGHDPSELTADMFLESDLGLDSIKTVELMNALASALPAELQDDFGAKLASGALFNIQTLGELEALIRGEEPGAPAPAALECASPCAKSAAPALPADQPPAVEPVARPMDILFSQYPFLVSHWAVCTCSLSSRIRLQGPFDAELARRAWNALLERHPMLRARFVIPPGCQSLKEYRLEVLDGVTAPAVDVTDLRHLDAPARDAFLNDETHRLLDKEWHLDQWPVHQFAAYRLADDLHEVVFSNHHVFSDGLGNQLVMREFVTLYAAAATGRPAPLPPSTALERYRETVQRINGWQDPEAEKALEAFLRAQGKDRFFWSPEKKGLPKNTRAANRTHHFCADPETTAALLRSAGKWRLPVNTLLAAAYLRALGSLDPALTQVILNIPTSGRVYPGTDAGHMVGCFAQNLALTLTLPGEHEALENYLPQLHERIESAIAAGYDRAQTRQAAVAVVDQLRLQDGRVGEPLATLIRSTIKSNLYLPYIGQTRIEESYGPLRVVEYHAATSTNPGTLDVLVEVFHGRFNMTANYDADYFTPALVAAIAEEFVRRIGDVARAGERLSAPPPAPLAAVDESLAARLLRVTGEVAHRAVGPEALDYDLESELGLDSLERIRIVGRLQQQMGPVDTRALLGCRRLREMATLLQGAAGKTEAGETNAMARPVPPPTLRPMNEELPPIPYLHVQAQCRRTPEALAVQAEHEELSYGRLHTESNRLAHFLRARGVRPGIVVGLLLTRSSNFATAVMGVLKAGGAYVPIDPAYPPARIEYIVAHARIDTILTEESVLETMGGAVTAALPARTFLLMDCDYAGLHRADSRCGDHRDWLGRAVWASYPEHEPECLNGPDDLMVVLYTSGSTGTPKGVALAHRGYMNRLVWHQKLFQLEPGERVAQRTSICFDISVWELFWPLMYGGVVCPVGADVLRDPWRLADWIETRRIAAMHFVPSLFGEFLIAMDNKSPRCEHLRWLIFSGEALPVAHVQRWFDRCGERVGLANLYGPTEASIDVTAHLIRSRPPEGTLRIPIGPAMPGVYLRILDESMKPAPEGAVGELWIGGTQLAQGYLHDPERTRESFRINPFSDIPGRWLYRTGDLVQRLPNGSYDFHGRVDGQIKIRGFRVELGEIEAALGVLPGIREAAALAIDTPNGHKRLVAWLVGREFPLKDLRAALAKQLPEYMLPHEVRQADALPKNHNGKLDRKSLKEWTETGKAPPLKAVSGTPEIQLPSADPSAGLPLGPAQSWITRFFQPPYQWAGYTRFRYLQPLDVDVFRKAIDALARRHPVLRSLFYQEHGEWRQTVAPPESEFSLDFYDGAHLTAEQRSVEIRRLVREITDELRIDRFPLWRVLVIKERDDAHDLTIVGHHMISDLVSNSILFRELWQIYGQLLVDRAPELAPPPPSYFDFVQWLAQPEQQEAQRRYADYWRACFPSREYAFRVPLDHHLGANDEASSASERFVLGHSGFHALNEARKHLQGQLYHLLLAAAYRLMAEWSGQSRVVLSHRSHGRDPGNGLTLYDSVGNYAVNFPLAVELDTGESWRELIGRIARGLAEAPLNGISFDVVGRQLPAHIYPDNNLTPVRINYLGNRSLPKSNIFEFIDTDWDQRYSPPSQQRISLIEIFLSMVEGELRVELNYSRNFFKAETIERLGRRYLELLNELSATPNSPTALRLVSPPAVPASEAPALIPLKTPRLQEIPLSARSAGRAVKAALVTGASRGIGRAIARKLAGQGIAVALSARDPAGLEAVAREIADSGGTALVVPADVRKLDEVQHLVGKVLCRFGRLDVLVNNAGITGMSALASSSPEEWKRIVEVNLFGAYHLCRSVVPHMIERRSGKIVNLGSDSSHIGYPLFSAYAASKHAVLGLTKSLSEELKPHDVQVNAVCPAFVDTDMTPPGYRARSIPVDAVADAVAFLASAEADWITGQHLCIYGRQDMYWFGSEKMAAVETRSGVRQSEGASTERRHA
ncbi:hypothetical protein sS8_2973 [Methylocaldum marinum]|uniref:Carrier domain-containing protein n=1 Tax=Methylocaldum marinum TaxID=1432792 RepID=A0A250KTQ1_9GAMM|nr:non-ribosomal peptide synthetase [Methylocaldum marinum]BBA34916.1 hypothetical protein sS8_2973 [Methylocaldum marinum]